MPTASYMPTSYVTGGDPSYRPPTRPKPPSKPGEADYGGGAGYTNTSSPDPTMTGFLDAWRRRMGTLEQNEFMPNTADTQRMIQGSDRDISERAAGGQTAAAEALTARGIGQSGIAGDAVTGITEAAQREKARAATTITLEQQRAQDDANMTRGLALNSFIQGGAGAHAQPGNLALGQMGLGIQQQGLAQQGERDQQAAAQFQAQMAEAARQRQLAMQLAILQMNSQTPPGPGGAGGGPLGSGTAATQPVAPPRPPGSGPFAGFGPQPRPR